MKTTTKEQNEVKLFYEQHGIAAPQKLLPREIALYQSLKENEEIFLHVNQGLQQANNELSNMVTKLINIQKQSSVNKHIVGYGIGAVLLCVLTCYGLSFNPITKSFQVSEQVVQK